MFGIDLDREVYVTLNQTIDMFVSKYYDKYTLLHAYEHDEIADSFCYITNKLSVHQMDILLFDVSRQLHLAVDMTMNIVSFYIAVSNKYIDLDIINPFTCDMFMCEIYNRFPEINIVNYENNSFIGFHKDIISAMNGAYFYHLGDLKVNTLVNDTKNHIRMLRYVRGDYEEPYY